MNTVVVRYTPRSEQADENQRLVEDVYAELAANGPDGLRYATFRLADGSFVHIAQLEGDENPLGSLASFGRFQDGIAERCEPGATPDAQPATLVGSYRLLAD
ncbi:MAG: hypothetical protein HKN41_11510 [Ilumatobacter sp.]|nr:hypothetical protein [Ilumatobacter sp.]